MFRPLLALGVLALIAVAVPADEPAQDGHPGRIDRLSAEALYDHVAVVRDHEAFEDMIYTDAMLRDRMLKSLRGSEAWSDMEKCWYDLKQIMDDPHVPFKFLGQSAEQAEKLSRRLTDDFAILHDRLEVGEATELLARINALTHRGAAIQPLLDRQKALNSATRKDGADLGQLARRQREEMETARALLPTPRQRPDDDSKKEPPPDWPALPGDADLQAAVQDQERAEADLRKGDATAAAADQANARVALEKAAKELADATAAVRRKHEERLNSILRTPCIALFQEQERIRDETADLAKALPSTPPKGDDREARLLRDKAHDLATRQKGLMDKVDGILDILQGSEYSTVSTFYFRTIRTNMVAVNDGLEKMDVNKYIMK